MDLVRCIFGFNKIRQELRAHFLHAMTTKTPRNPMLGSFQEFVQDRLKHPETHEQDALEWFVAELHRVVFAQFRYG